MYEYLREAEAPRKWSSQLLLDNSHSQTQWLKSMMSFILFTSLKFRQVHLGLLLYASVHIRKAHSLTFDD